MMWKICDSPETMRKLCLSTKFPHQESRWNYGIFRSETGYDTGGKDKKNIWVCIKKKKGNLYLNISKRRTQIFPHHV